MTLRQRGVLSPAMFDVRPVGYVTGLLIAALGATMLVPMLVDLLYRNGHGRVFFIAALATAIFGGGLALSCRDRGATKLSVQQTFILTTGVWLTLPIFGAIPFWLGQPQSDVVDAFFEAMSGLTTTGATVLVGLDRLPEGILLWRSMLQWFGGIGIIVVAMVFLPELRVGGMQIFRSESFDTDGKVLPRAAQIASRISGAYFLLTLLCAGAYLLAGVQLFPAINHALTTVATGGFSTFDQSFGALAGAPEYIAALFMALASLPFVRYVQLMAGAPKPLLHDPQIRGFLVTLLVCCAMVVLFLYSGGMALEQALRQTLFNVTSILTGTGYASTDYQLWGAFAVVLFFLIGLIGGCAGSTTCSIKVFRYQLLLASIRTQIKRIHSPHGIFTPRYDGKSVSEDVLSSVMVFFVAFIVSLGILAILLSATGLDLITSLSGAAAALANIGPGLGETIGPAGNYAPLSDTAKWLLAFGMLIGRLELMAVFVLFGAHFWRG